MADRHERDKATFRPPPEVKAAAHAELAKADWTLNDFLVACLVALTKSPKEMLAQLERFRPPRKMGRPRKGGTSGELARERFEDAP
jgi:hypothetical protein